MRFSTVSIAGLGVVDAPHRIPTRDLEAALAPTSDRLGLPRDLLSSLTGIRERRFWDEGVTPSAVATLAATRALEDAGVDRRRVGVLVSTSVCKDFIEPSVAALVHGALGLAADCANFDVGNACLGFLSGMQVVANMIERGQASYGLVVDGESSRQVTEATVARLLDPACDGARFREGLAALTLGSGAAAMVLCRSDLAPSAPRLCGGVALAATEHRGLCRGQVDGMVTDAGALLVAGVDLARRTFGRAREELGWSEGDLDELVLHQVSAVHTRRLCEALGLDPRRALTVFEDFGNMGPAAIPTVLARARDRGRLVPGARVALMGIGSGLNCSMMDVLW